MLILCHAHIVTHNARPLPFELMNLLANVKTIISLAYNFLRKCIIVNIFFFLRVKIPRNKEKSKNNDYCKIQQKRERENGGTIQNKWDEMMKRGGGALLNALPLLCKGMINTLKGRLNDGEDRGLREKKMDLTKSIQFSSSAL